MSKQNIIITKPNTKLDIDCEFQDIEDVLMGIFNILDECDRVMNVVGNEIKDVKAF